MVELFLAIFGVLGEENHIDPGSGCRKHSGTVAQENPKGPKGTEKLSDSDFC